MNISNNLSLYCKSMGKIFKIRHIAKSDHEANEFCRKHRDTGVIAEDNDSGLIFVADLYQVQDAEAFAKTI